MQKHQVRSVIGGKGCVKLKRISATKLEHIAGKLQVLLPIASEYGNLELHYHISKAYMIAYRSAAELYELGIGKKGVTK